MRVSGYLQAMEKVLQKNKSRPQPLNRWSDIMPNNRILKTKDLFACRDRGVSLGGVGLFPPPPPPPLSKSKPELFGVVEGSVTSSTRN